MWLGRRRFESGKAARLFNSSSWRVGVGAKEIARPNLVPHKGYSQA